MAKIDEMNTLAQELLCIRSKIKELKAREDEITNSLKQEMVKSGLNHVEGDSWSASFTVVDSSSFDSKALKEENPDIYEKYVRATTYSRFRLIG